jgi:hypothetical protein
VRFDGALRVQRIHRRHDELPVADGVCVAHDAA